MFLSKYCVPSPLPSPVPYRGDHSDRQKNRSSSGERDSPGTPAVTQHNPFSSKRRQQPRVDEPGQPRQQVPARSEAAGGRRPRAEAPGSSPKATSSRGGPGSCPGPHLISEMFSSSLSQWARLSSSLSMAGGEDGEGKTRREQAARGPGMCSGSVCHPGSPPGAYLHAQGAGQHPAGFPSCYPRLQLWERPGRRHPSPRVGMGG